jgi:hypothetical protein
MNKIHAEVPQGETPRTAWICAAPKTGSTLLTCALKRMLGWKSIWPLNKGFWRQAQELVLTPEFNRCRQNVLIPQTHTMFNENSLKWIKEYDIKVIIPFRDIHDSLVSASDHSAKQSGLPFGYLPDTIKDMDSKARLDYLITVATGWYIQFYTGWHIASQIPGVSVLYVSYNHLTTKTADALKTVQSGLSVIRTDEEIIDAVNHASKDKTRFNVGGSRAKDMTKDQKAAVDRCLTQASLNPDTKEALIRVWKNH